LTLKRLINWIVCRSGRQLSISARTKDRFHSRWTSKQVCSVEIYPIPDDGGFHLCLSPSDNNPSSSKLVASVPHHLSASSFASFQSFSLFSLTFSPFLPHPRQGPRKIPRAGKEKERKKEEKLQRITSNELYVIGHPPPFHSQVAIPPSIHPSVSSIHPSFLPSVHPY
jgi:hypothetical protein